MTSHPVACVHETMQDNLQATTQSCLSCHPSRVAIASCFRPHSRSSCRRVYMPACRVSDDVSYIIKSASSIIMNLFHIISSLSRPLYVASDQRLLALAYCMVLLRDVAAQLPVTCAFFISACVDTNAYYYCYPACSLAQLSHCIGDVGLHWAYHPA